jgi:hypothetical protein
MGMGLGVIGAGLLGLSALGNASGNRPIYVIAGDIRRDWKNVYFGAVPYLEAMSRLNSVTDRYGVEDAKSILLYFLSNATSWRGPKAREIKEEIKRMIK